MLQCTCSLSTQRSKFKRTDRPCGLHAPERERTGLCEERDSFGLVVEICSATILKMGLVVGMRSMPDNLRVASACVVALKVELSSSSDHGGEQGLPRRADWTVSAGV